jgi:predicted DNA-binding transcriptional regulator AlpA
MDQIKNATNDMLLPLMRSEEVRFYLGGIGKNALSQMIKQGVIPLPRRDIGRRLRWNRKEFMDWLNKPSNDIGNNGEK